MYRLIDRYIIREFLPPFLIGLLVFTFVLEIPPIRQYAESFIAKGVAWSTVLRILLTLLPQALSVTIPMAFLLGLLIAFGRLSADREVVALQACGVSLYRLLCPVALLAVIACAVTAYIMIVAVPDANQTFREISYEVIAARSENDIKPRVFFQDFPRQVLYVRDVDAQGGWVDVFLTDSTHPAEMVVYVARSGRVLLDRARRSVEVVLSEGAWHRIPAKTPDKYSVERFKTILIALDPETVFPRGGLLKGDAEMTIAELKARIADLERQGIPAPGSRIYIHQKFSIPVACLVFALIGVGLGVTNRRDGKLASFTLGFLVILIYYVIMFGGRSLAMGALIPAWAAPWLPNLVLGPAGLLLVVWRVRSSDRPIRIPLPFWRRAVRPSSEPGNTAPRQAATGNKIVVVVRVPHFPVPSSHILDWYVAKLNFRVMVLAFASLLGIFYISTFIDLSDKLFRGKATGSMLFQYFWYETPQYIYYIIPMALLIGALVTVGLLTKNSELVVMKACGISLYRVAAPLVITAVVAGLTLFWLEEQVLAYSNRHALSLNNQIRYGTPRMVDALNRQWVVGKGGSIYHFLSFDSSQNALSNLTIYDFGANPWRITRRTFAAGAAYAPIPNVSGSAWRGRQGWAMEFSQTGEARSREAFVDRALHLEPPSYFKTDQPEAERMTYNELKRYIDDLRPSGFYTVPYAVALQRKIAFPFVTLVMTLLAVPFAALTGRRGAMYAIGAGIVLAIAYWIAMSVFAAIGSGGGIGPVLAAWAPNILFGAAAIYLLLTVRT